jgi:hypothetical protein
MVHVGECYMGHETFGPATVRDWRLWHTDWKGTTTSGDKFHPDPRDFYLGANSCTDIQGFDSYNFWGVAGHTGTAWTPWQNRFSEQWNVVGQIFPNIPIAIGEWACAEYDGDETHVTHTWSAANEALTRGWVDQAVATMLANNIVMADWFQGTQTDMTVNNAPAANNGPWRISEFNSRLLLSNVVKPVLT